MQSLHLDRVDLPDPSRDFGIPGGFAFISAFRQLSVSPLLAEGLLADEDMGAPLAANELMQLLQDR